MQYAFMFFLTATRIVITTHYSELKRLGLDTTKGKETNKLFDLNWSFFFQLWLRSSIIMCFFVRHSLGKQDNMPIQIY